VRWLSALACRHTLCRTYIMPEDTNKNNTPWDRMTDRQNELQYHDVSTYLRAWYKGKKTDSPIELGDWPRIDLGTVPNTAYRTVGTHLGRNPYHFRHARLTGGGNRWFLSLNHFISKEKTDGWLAHPCCARSIRGRELGRRNACPLFAVPWIVGCVHSGAGNWANSAAGLLNIHVFASQTHLI
jgi:hypothetical protein